MLVFIMEITVLLRYGSSSNRHDYGRWSKSFTVASMCSTPPDPPRARPARIPMIEEREEDVVEETPPGMWSAQYWSPSLRFAYSLATRSAERLYEMKSLRSELRKRLVCGGEGIREGE